MPPANFNLQKQQMKIPWLIFFTDLPPFVPLAQDNDKDYQEKHDQAACSNCSPHPPAEPQQQSSGRRLSNAWLSNEKQTMVVNDTWREESLPLICAHRRFTLTNTSSTHSWGRLAFGCHLGFGKGMVELFQEQVLKAKTHLALVVVKTICTDFGKSQCPTLNFDD